MTASSPAYRQNFGPFAADVYHAPFPDEYRGWTTDRAIDALEELFSTEVMPEQVAAVVIEPQLGEGGFVPAPAAFLQRLRALTERLGIVLVADEVQSGFGRTGRMFGYQHAGIEPDLVVMAKSLAAGLPLSAVVGKAAIMDAPLPGGLGGTYGGNPLACASALAVLDVFETEGLVARGGGDRRRDARRRCCGCRRACRRSATCAASARCWRSSWSTDPATKAPDAELAQRVIDRARERGLLLLKCGPHKNVVRLLPPLTASAEEIACRRRAARSGGARRAGVVLVRAESMLRDPLRADRPEIPVRAAPPRRHERDDEPDGGDDADHPYCVHVGSPFRFAAAHAQRPAVPLPVDRPQSSDIPDLAARCASPVRRARPPSGWSSRSSASGRTGTQSERALPAPAASALTP